MHGISTGCEGIPRREGQFRFTAPWGALIPSVTDAVFHPRRAARNLFGLLYRRFIIVDVQRKRCVNADDESMSLAVAEYFIRR